MEKLYIVYEINKIYNISSYPALWFFLFGSVSLTKNAEVDKYRCPGYGIGFDRHGFFSHPSDGTGRNVIIFGVDMSPSIKIVLTLGKWPLYLTGHTFQNYYLLRITLKVYPFLKCIHWTKQVLHI